MATIYQKDGQSLYDFNGQTYDARTGQPFSGAPAIPTAQAYTQSKVPTVVSAQPAQDAATAAIADYSKIQARLTPPTTTEASKPPQTPAEQPKPEPVTLIHPETLQPVTFEDPTLNRASIQNYLNSGYTLEKGALPSGISLPDADPVAAEEDKEYQALIGELEAYRSRLTGAQASYVDSIKKSYETRKRTMEDINMREQRSLQSFGISSGSMRRSASFQGVLSEQERQGVQRLSELDAEEARLIAEAERAYAAEDFKALSEKISLYNDNQSRKQSELENIQKLAMEQNKLIQAEASRLAKQEADAQKDFEKSINDIVKDAISNMAPPEVIEAIRSAPDVATALTSAGSYLQSGTGIVGEYLFYQRQAEQQGQVPVDFNTFQTMDANRKATIAAATGSSGLNSKQTQNFLRITDKFQADPFINNALKGETAIQIADQVLADPNNAANQLKALYVLVKNLDPDSAVREGEIALADQTQSYLQRFQTSLARIQSGQVISPDAAELLAQATKDLAGAWTTTAEKRKKQYKAQAAGADVLDAFDQYLSTAELQPSTSDQIIQNQANNPLNLDTSVSSTNPLGI